MSEMNSSDFVTKYFEENNYEIVNQINRLDHIAISAKKRNSKMPKIETFISKEGSLKKLVHSGSKYHPWSYQVVARQIDTKSYLDEMRAAINQDK